MKTGYKQTEVGMIPEDWEAKELSSLCTMKSGESITASKIDGDSKYPCYGGNGMRGYTSRYTHDGSFALIGRQGALCGNVVGVEGRFYASEHAVVVTPRSGTDIQFLTYALGAMRLNRLSEASAQPGLSVTKLLHLRTGAPQEKAEQRAIAAALSDVDTLIASLDRLIAKKRDLKQAAMQQLLSGQTRLPGFEGEWEMKQLGKIGTWKGGMTPSMQNPDYWEGGTVPWISSGDVKSILLAHTGFSITHLAVKNCATTMLPANSIVLVTRSGILRKFLPVAMNVIPMAINQDIKALIPGEAFSSAYLLHALIGNGDRILKRCMKAGTTVESIEYRWLKAFAIPIPPLTEQTAIAAVLSEMDAELAALEQRREKTRALKQGMMQELLTGRTRLVAATDET